MTGATHSPGPWTVNRTVSSGNQALGYHITGPRDGSLHPICYGGDTPHDSGELMANARLIAAAPDLLVVVQMVANIGEYRELVEAMASCLRPHERDGFVHMFREQARAVVAAVAGGKS